MNKAETLGGNALAAGIAVVLFSVAILLFGAAEARSDTGGIRAIGDSAHVPGEVVVAMRGENDKVIELPDSVRVGQAVRALRQNRKVAYAAPNHVARASAFVPRDPGRLSPVREVTGEIQLGPDGGPSTWPLGSAGGWTSRQWNFLPWRDSVRFPTSPGGINAVGAWRNLRHLGASGGRGVVVAVVDTGVAYRSLGRRYRRNPDFGPRQFTRGYDFVRDNRVPLDRNGHGTHIAGTIGQQTDNGIGVTGIAYNAKIMPVRVLDANGNGTSDRIADGIRWAADRGADIINMSFNFGCGDKVPNVASAVRYAYKQGSVLVGSVGNAQAESCTSVPATLRPVIGVGGVTEGGCLGSYSLAGRGLDLVAPGGGTPIPGFDCEAAGTRPIYQLTFTRPSDRSTFGFPPRFFGTSMAAAHASGVGALVLASGVLGDDPTGADVRRHLIRTARGPSLMPRTNGYGAGILDAAAATWAPAVAEQARRGSKANSRGPDVRRR